MKQNVLPAPARLDSEAFKVVQSAVARNYDTIAIPMMGTGATDMAQVRIKGQQCFGVGPASDLEDAPKGFGAHSDQERILEAEVKHGRRLVIVGYMRRYDAGYRQIKAAIIEDAFRRGGKIQLDQPIERLGSVALLRAMGLGDQHDDAVVGQPLAGETLQPSAHVVGKRRRMADIEAQLHECLKDFKKSGAY